MYKTIIKSLIIGMAIMVSLSSCDEDEEVAQRLSGVWETTDIIFPRTYKGQTLTPIKTVIQIDQERSTSTVGYGVAIEYFDNQTIPVAYHHIRWETWRRKDISVGIEWDYQETDDKFKSTDYKLNDKELSGMWSLNNDDENKKRVSFRRVSTAPDVSKVKYWGYSELLPTWHQVTFEGNIFIQREYQGKTYQPKNVVITFDVDPAYNTGYMGKDKAYIKEEYDDAPWGTYLADSILFWELWHNNSYLRLYRAEGYDGYNYDYEFHDIQFTDNELKGRVFVRTNVFEDFTLKRVNNPDWSAIKEWGFSKWIK